MSKTKLKRAKARMSSWGQRKLLRIAGILGVVTVMVGAGALIIRATATTYVAPAEAEAGFLTGPATRCLDTTSSGNASVKFGLASCNPAGKTFANPIATSIADPGVLRHDGKYYMVSTSGCPCFDIFVSDDLVNWKQSGKSVFNGDGTHPWGTHSFWAPEIHALRNGRFAVYYSAFNPNANKLQIGVATADSILGPYVDIGFPLVREAYGVIDINFLRDDDTGKQYLYWKEDNINNRIIGQEVDAAGTTVIGSQTTVLTRSLSWEGAGIEGPWVIKRDGMYYMFYSGEFFATDKYAVGIARSSTPLGTFAKKGNPILTSSDRWKGPGHNSTVRAGQTDYMVYHAWDRTITGDRAGMIDKITWVNGWPEMPNGGHPTDPAQLYPQ